MFKKTFTAAALIAVTAFTALPAAAQGMLSFHLNANNQKEADIIRGGLMLYQIARGVESGAYVNQNGNLNGAAIQQAAAGGSTGIIHQEGNRHNATLRQTGYNQAHGIFQFGNGTNAAITQNRNGRAGLTFQFGFD